MDNSTAAAASAEQQSTISSLSNSVAMDPRALETWDMALHELLIDAEQGLFASRLQLDTRTGRVVYTGSPKSTLEAEDGNRLANSIMIDVPAVMLATPANASLKTRSNRARIAAYLSQWLCTEAITNLVVRACLESSVTESKLLRAIFNTAMGIHVSWLSWSKERFEESAMNQSASRLLTYSVMTLYYIFLRETLVEPGARVVSKLFRDNSTLKELAISLSILLFFSDEVSTELETGNSVAWMFASQQERSLLKNAVGCCMEMCLKTSVADDFLKYMTENQFFESILVALLVDASPETDICWSVAYSISLPFPKESEMAKYLYPWPEILLKHFVTNAHVKRYLEASKNEELKHDFKQYVERFNQAKQEALIAQIASSEVSKQIGSIRESVSSSSASASVEAREKKKPEKKDKKRKQGMQQPSGESAKANTRPRVGKGDSYYMFDEVTPQEWKHIKAADALMDLTWAKGIPWLTPYSSATNPNKVRPIERFSTGGPEAPKPIVNALLSICELPLDLKAIEPVFTSPHPNLMNFAAVGSARASLIAQVERQKPNLKENGMEIIRSTAFCMVAAVRAQNSKTSDNGGSPQLWKSSNNNAAATAKGAIMKTETTTPSSKALSRFCQRSGLPASGAHVAIARAIKKNMWKPPKANTTNE